MKTRLLLFFLLCVVLIDLRAQDSIPKRVHLDVPLFEWPQNEPTPYAYPSLNQALGLSYSNYQLAFWGMHEGISRLILGKNPHPKKTRVWLNRGVNYLSQLLFCQYGSELPIPLGVWAHEEYHRAVLKTGGLYSFNGNWIFNRWDGTVYGPSDEQLSRLKKEQLNVLLYSYVAGVQSEIALNEKLNRTAFVSKEKYNKAALILYNSYYMFNYFNFSASAASDTVKRVAPSYEAKKPAQRDFAGADLTAWVYDMMSPDSAYSKRDAFPNGEGLNRRIGRSDLSEEGRTFLNEQKKLSLLNFLNPGILGISKITLFKHYGFLPYMSYYPTHFGNMISGNLLLQIRNKQMFVSLQKYQSASLATYGFQFAVLNLKHHPKWSSDLQLSFWQQAEKYRDNKSITGGAAQWRLYCQIHKNLQATMNVDYKSKGWLLNNPYLEAKLSAGIGLRAAF